MNNLTSEQRRRGLVNVKKLRIDLAKISERKHYKNKNSLERLKIKANKLENISQGEFDAKFKVMSPEDFRVYCEENGRDGSHY